MRDDEPAVDAGTASEGASADGLGARERLRRAGARARDALTGRPPPWALATAAYVIAFVILTWPLLARITHATYGGPGDGWALIWQTWQRSDQGPSYFSAPINPDLAWPFGATPATAVLLSNVVTELPNLGLLLIGIDDVLAYNLMILAVAVGSSLAMYGAVRRMGVRPAAAGWAGLAYLLVPWHLDRIAIHLTLSLTAALPLLVLGVIEWCRRPGLRSGALLVGALALATYTHAYYGLAAGLVLVAALPLALVVARRAGRLRQMLSRTAALAAPLALVPVPLAIALLVQSDSVSRQLDRPTYLAELVARPYLVGLPSVDNPVFGDASRGWIESRGLPANTGELALYLGWVTLALALVAVAAAVAGVVPRLPVLAAALMAAVGLVFSLPETLPLPLLGETTMPVGYLQDRVDFISTPARFFVLTVTGVIVMAAFALGALVGRLPRAAALGAVGLVCALSALELAVGGDRVVEASAPPPIVRAILDEVPDGEPIAQYPSTIRSLRPTADQLYWQRLHGHPLLAGANDGSKEDLARIAVADATLASTPPLLALLGFAYATYEPGLGRSLGVTLEAALAYVPPAGLRVVRRTDDGSLLMRVSAAPAAGIAIRADGFSLEGGRPNALWLNGRRADLLVCASAAGVHTLVSDGLAFARARRLRFGSATTVLIPAEGVIAPIRVRMLLRRGWQRVPVELVGSRPDRPVDVVPRSDDARELSVSLGLVGVSGPSGDPAACRSGLREAAEG